MKKLLLTSVALTALFGGSAFAADLRPAYKAAPPPPPVYSWTGIYWGVNVGYSWGEAKNDVTLLGVGTASSSRKMDGAIGGFQAGYNWQFNRNWVFGVEADISFTDINDNTLGIPVHVDYVGSARARLGYAWDRMMLYGTGGLAFVRAGGAGVHQSDTGFALGGGLEWAFAHRWSAKVEYIFHGFDTAIGDSDIQTVKFGVNYRF
jgi:outer membrane immunogenic protein